MLALAAAIASPALAQQTAPDIIVTGTRTVGVKAANSAAPVQVVGASALLRTGETDLANILTTAVPSFNTQNTGGDAAGLTVQASLRGLNPNDTLVLIDGKRRHTTANLAVDGGSAYSGSATTDLSFIPEGAIDHVEVLTDGAAAQYGTDAIAGVVNIILKKSASGGVITGTGGEDYDGEGETGSWSINKGMTLGDNGFVNVTLEERTHDFTEVGQGDARIQNPDGSVISGLAFPETNGTKATDYPNENRLNGDPQYNIYNGMYNAAYDFGDDLEVYSTGSYGYRLASHFENYRVPDKVSGVTSTGQVVYPFPDGFDPREEIRETDYSFTGGVKGTFAGVHYDLSSTYGSDHDDIYVVDSANAQLFPLLQALSPTAITPQTSFYNGDFTTTQLTNNIDLSDSFEVGLASPLNLAVGFEQRHESYTIGAGEPASYYGAGAQSFDGYTPFDQGTHSRDNTGGYIDLATDVFTGLHVDLAGRYESYSDFGDTKVGKATARYDFNPMIAIRGTVSTGFRAPTLAEEYYSGTNVSPSFADVQLPPNSTAAQVAGFQPLKPEKSTNYSIGFVLHPVPRLQITADFYEIDIKDRILVSGFLYGTDNIGPGGSILTVSQGVLNAIAAKGVSLDSGLSYTGISVFANAANTKTQGADVTANYASDFGEFGHVDWSLGYNYNDTIITKQFALPSQVAVAAGSIALAPTFSQTSFLTPNAASALTSATPRNKAILSAYWTLDRWSVNLRDTIYGPTAQWSGNNAYLEKIPTTSITDLDIGFKITKAFKVEVGANNIFNTKPPVTPGLVGGGHVYNVPDLFSPWGVDGGYYYTRLTYTF